MYMAFEIYENVVRNTLLTNNYYSNIFNRISDIVSHIVISHWHLLMIAISKVRYKRICRLIEVYTCPGIIKYILLPGSYILYRARELIKTSIMMPYDERALVQLSLRRERREKISIH